MKPFLVTLLLAGCTADFKDTAGSFSTQEADTDTDTDADTDTDTDTDADTDTDSDTDADTDTDTDTDTGPGPNPDCNDYQGTPVAGATSFFQGDFAINSDDTVTGTESWLLFANPRWKELGGGDCTVVWSITGLKEAPTSTCGSCAYSLALDANADMSLSDCPTEVFEGDEEFSTTYNVKIVDGVAIFYFAGSGNELGTGTGSSTAAAYLTEGSCVYF